MRHRIWIISNQHWPRAFLRAELMERGYEVDSFEGMPQALSALEDCRTGRPDLILLELIGQPAGPVNLKRLEEDRIPVVAMGGGMEIQDRMWQEFPWAGVLARPYSIEDACNLCRELLYPESG